MVDIGRSRLTWEEEENPEEIVDLSDSSDEFEVFNQTIHSEDDFDEMGVQRKP